ncbi:site-specific integrase [Bradyrhizobium sp. AUGA SZCCT0431]|uniref:tyrosine-type recombinase/integrase n=1 Tax=Bradyrhizobium sp. AUGA SZCCT0431 TaxID=2807674 RepID=UPI001BA5E6DD|nr:site-specific integrase [Bradyrhizobium sp. AUGA SZCCT0431]MBR1145092.1 integrase arm-type DNA-binding domain-containing protein [Bradyrhizobium sp. AUGA SZCCT0431]
MQGKITKRKVDTLEAGQVLHDQEIKGFVARCLNSGAVTYGYRYRDKGTGKQRWLGLGLHGSITADEARDLAKKRAGDVADHRDPVAELEEKRAAAARERQADTNTVDAVLDQFINRHVDKLRSAKTVKRSFEVYVRPRIGRKSIYDVKRLDIVQLLDAIEDADKAPTADRVLAYLRKAFNWYAARDEGFVPPIVKGMARTKPADRARTRALADDEIRSVWQALNTGELPAAFCEAVRALLLTAQRRDEIGLAQAEELDGDTLLIPAERYKTGLPNAVPLTAAALRWFADRKTGYIFSTTGGKKPFSGWSKSKRELDALIARQRKKDGMKPMAPWVLHDLRRTARSLMSRAGVSSDIAEMVLGHKLAGVRGVYDRHSYAAEKRDALEKLAGLVALILDPPADNVVQIAERK